MNPTSAPHVTPVNDRGSWSIFRTHFKAVAGRIYTSLDEITGQPFIVDRRLASVVKQRDCELDFHKSRD